MPSCPSRPSVRVRAPTSPFPIVFYRKEHSAASRNQIPPFPKCAQRRRERGEKVLAKLRDSDRLQRKDRIEKSLWAWGRAAGRGLPALPSVTKALRISFTFD